MSIPKMSLPKTIRLPKEATVETLIKALQEFDKDLTVYNNQEPDIVLSTVPGPYGLHFLASNNYEAPADVITDDWGEHPRTIRHEMGG